MLCTNYEVTENIFKLYKHNIVKIKKTAIYSERSKILIKVYAMTQSFLSSNKHKEVLILVQLNLYNVLFVGTFVVSKMNVLMLHTLKVQFVSYFTFYKLYQEIRKQIIVLI